MTRLDARTWSRGARTGALATLGGVPLAGVLGGVALRAVGPLPPARGMLLIASSAAVAVAAAVVLGARSARRAGRPPAAAARDGVAGAVACYLVVLLAGAATAPPDRLLASATACACGAAVGSLLALRGPRRWRPDRRAAGLPPLRLWKD